MERQAEIIDMTSEPFPFPVGSQIRYLGELVWELPDGKVLLKKDMEFAVNFVHEEWVGTYMPGYPEDETTFAAWGTYGDSISNVCLYMRDTTDWAIVVK